MNKISELINKYDLAELLHDDIFIDPNDITKEAVHNSVTITFEKEDIIGIGKLDLIELFNMIINSKIDILKNRGSMSMVFYLWYDDQSNSLCYSLVSKHEPVQLPFGCKLNTTNNLGIIMDLYLRSSVNYEININDFVASDISDNTAFDNSSYVLDVFLMRIPT